MGRFNSTLSNHLGDPAEELRRGLSMDALLEKKPKTKDDINRIEELLPTTKDILLQRSALMILLQYQRSTAVRNFLLDDTATLSDPLQGALLFQALILCNDLEMLTQRAKQMDLKLRAQMLSRAVHSLLLLKKKRSALTLWIQVSKLDFPELRVLHKHNSAQHSSILSNIVSAYNNVKGISDAGVSLLPQSEYEQWFLMLSYSFFRLEDWDNCVNLWKLTPEHLRTSPQLVHTIRACSNKQNYKKAMKLYEENVELHTKQVQKAMITIVTGLEYKDDAFLLTKQLMTQEVFSPYKTVRILETLLKFKRVDEFDVLVEDYTKVSKRLTPMLFNVLMRRELDKGDTVKFYTHLKSIYSSPSSAPTSKTFQLVFEQIAKSGNISTAMSLLQSLIRRGQLLKTSHFTSILETIANSDDITALGKVTEMMRRQKIEPDQQFITALMGLHYKFNNYDEVQRLFFLEESGAKPNQKMYILLMKSYLAMKETASATAALKAIKETSRGLPHVLYSQMEYYCHLGEFQKALKVLEFMKKRGYTIDSKYYTVMLTGYNNHRQYENTLLLVNLLASEKFVFDSYMYHQLLVALVRLDIVNKKNFTRPTEVVDNIMESYRLNKLPISEKLHFKSIKPLTSALLKSYRPAEASRLLQNFRVLRPEFDVDYNLNFLKEEMILYSTDKNWPSFEPVLYNFQERLRHALLPGEKIPKHMKKIYNAVIPSIFQYYLHIGDLKEFNKMFKRLIFVHGFTFDSKTLNWIVRRFIRQESTLHYGLELIEKRLVGGMIARNIIRSHNAKRVAQGEPKLVATSRTELKRPYLRLGHISQKELVDSLFTYIVNTRLGARKKLRRRQGIVNEKWVDPYKHLCLKYPKLMKNLPELRQKFYKKVKST